MPPESVRVAVVSADPLARAGLAAVLESLDGIEVAANADVEGAAWLDAPAPDARGDEAVAPTATRPDVAVVDTAWSSEAALERIADAAGAGVASVALAEDVETAAAAMRAGALGALPRDVDGRQLGASVLAVARGLAVWHPDLGTDAPTAPHAVPPAEQLTARELEVLRLVTDGLTNKAIAHHLGISENTVKFHVNAILGKLGAGSRTEAALLAVRLGFVML